MEAVGFGFVVSTQPKQKMARTPYPDDLTDAQWHKIAPMIPSAKPGGRRRTQDMREILNAIFYMLRAGCAWRLLPHDLPRWQTVYYYFRRWQADGTWERIHYLLRAEVRVRAGRCVEPSSAIADSQSVKTADKALENGYDAGKNVKGRKRHILVDTMGLLLIVLVHSAHRQERQGFQLLLEWAKEFWPRLQLIWVDGGYQGQTFADWVKSLTGWILEVVKRPEGSKGFSVLPRRWVVERTFAWFNRYRRLGKDYEYLPTTSETMIYVAMIHLMLKRLTSNSSVIAL